MRRALGKGLSELIADQFEGGPLEALIESIVPNPRQPRERFEDRALEELATSMKEVGILQPLLVRPSGEGRYELIAGERRLRAAKLAGLTSVPIVVRSANSQASLELALIENVQREDINAMECAQAYRQLMDEFGLTQEQVAERVGKSRSAVANAVRLLRLPGPIQSAVREGVIEEGHAKAMLGLPDESRQLFALKKVLAQEWTVRDIERATKPPEPHAPRPSKPLDPHDEAIGDILSRHFGGPTRLERGARTSRLVIDFYDDEDLQRILDLLGVSL